MDSINIDDIDIRSLTVPNRRELIYTLYATGEWRIKDLAQRFEVDRKTIYNAIKEVGVKEYDYMPDALKAVAIERIDKRIDILQIEIEKARSESKYLAIAKLMTVLRREEEFKLNLVNAMHGSVEGGGGVGAVNINLFTNIPRSEKQVEPAEEEKTVRITGKIMEDREDGKVQEKTGSN